MKIEYTRALLNAALDGSLDKVEYKEDPFFGVQVPTSCPGVPEEILNPRNTWANKEAYDKKANYLAGLFRENFRQFEEQTPKEVIAAGPKTPEMV
ncbi:MAG: phosphoenolpyruvate carboxykinase (ATP) [candidate division Zixibacteria bacterium]|nr:phosphoenolpyruvate carboxykinase (ATP) [candidate division Zixibacteria bacterium]